MKTALRILVSLAVAAALLALLMAWSDLSPREVGATLASLPLASLGLAMACHLGIYALRAWRFRLLIPPPVRPSLARALVVSSAHNLAAYVLPAKTGEASFVVYLKTVAGVRAARGLASLVVSRLLDLAVLCTALGLACGVVGEGLARGAAAGLVAAGVVFLLAGARSDLAVPIALRGLRALRVDRTRLGRKVVAKAEEVREALASAGGDGRFLRAAALSVPLWAGVFLFYAVLARGMGMADSLSFAETAFGSSVAVLFNLLPVNGLAGFGTQEAGWTLGFEFLGVDREAALSTGLGVHLVQLFDVIVFGIGAHLAMGLLGAPRGAGETRVEAPPSRDH